MNWLDVAEHALIWASAIPAVLSPFVHARTPWRSTVMGKHLMAYMTVLGVILGVTVADMYVRPDPVWFEVLQLILFIGLPVVMWWRLILQVQGQRHTLLPPQHRKEPAPDDDQP